MPAHLSIIINYNYYNIQYHVVTVLLQNEKLMVYDTIVLNRQKKNVHTYYIFHFKYFY